MIIEADVVCAADKIYVPKEEHQRAKLISATLMSKVHEVRNGNTHPSQKSANCMTMIVIQTDTRKECANAPRPDAPRS